MSAPIIVPEADRLMIARLYAKMDYTVGAEIGTAAGDYAHSICRLNPGVKLYCIDAYTSYSGYDDYNAGQMEKNYEKAVEILKPYDVEFIRSYSSTAVGLFDDGALDFVYIDANHEWPYIAQDLYCWDKKVRSGGIISGHDYEIVPRSDGKCHVKSALLGYTDAFNIDEWFVYGTGDGRVGSWYWVKQ